MSTNVKSYEMPSIIFKPVDRPQGQTVTSDKSEIVSMRLGDHKNYAMSRKSSQYNNETCNIDKGLSAATWTWIVIIPVVIFVLLILIAPSFVKDENPNQPQELNYSNIILWTIIISIIMWVSMFAFNKCCSNCQ